METAPEDAARIAAVCQPCEQFLPEGLRCRAVLLAGQFFLKVFDNKRCRPREFLMQFLRRHLGRRYGRHESRRAEDLASRIVVELHETPPAGPLPSPDLVGMRRFLAKVAVSRAIDELRESLGRIRCGNCLHHHAGPDRKRQCTHPDPQHPWSGKEVRASVDPRQFEPPCHEFASRRGGEDNPDEGRLDQMQDPTAGQESELLARQRSRLLAECFAVIQKEDPRIALVLHLDFFRDLVNEEIARELKLTVRTVTRYKRRGMTLLREELERRGVQRVADLEWNLA